jgi:hypothetical protein
MRQTLVEPNFRRYGSREVPPFSPRTDQKGGMPPQCLRLSASAMAVAMCLGCGRISIKQACGH